MGAHVANRDGSAVFRKKISIEYLAGVLGTSLALSVALSLLVVFPSAVFRSEGGNALTVVAAISMVAGYFLASLLQERIASAKHPPLIICAAVGSISLCLLTVGSIWISDIGLVCMLVIASVGTSMLIANWFCWVCAQKTPQETIAIAGASALACVACLVELVLGFGGGF